MAHRSANKDVLVKVASLAEHDACQPVEKPLTTENGEDALVSSLVVRPMGKHMLKVVQDVVSARLRRLAGLLFSR